MEIWHWIAGSFVSLKVSNSLVLKMEMKRCNYVHEQVQIGSHSFTYDYVYGNMGSPSPAIYDDCVAPLVDALFHGYNATVLAYGQV